MRRLASRLPLALATCAVIVRTAIRLRSGGSPAASPTASTQASGPPARSRLRVRALADPVPAFAMLVLAVVALALAEFGRGRISASPTSPPARHRVAATTSASYVGLSHLPTGRAIVAANKGQGGGSTAWLLGALGSRLVATPVKLGDGRAQPGRTVSVGPALRSPLETVEVNAWGGRPAAFVLSTANGGVNVEVRSLDGRQRVLARGRAPVGRTLANTSRDLGIGNAADGSPELFVIDRGRGEIEVRVFSGGSRFAQMVRSTYLVEPGLAEPNLSPLVASVSSAASDIAFVSTRPPTSSTAPEIHVLLGTADYRRRAEQQILPGPFPADADHLTVIHIRARPFLVVLDAALPRLALVVL